MIILSILRKLVLPVPNLDFRELVKLCLNHTPESHKVNTDTDSSLRGSSYFGASNAIFYMTSLRCSGSEKRLTDCGYSSNALTSCGSGRHAGVACVGMWLVLIKNLWDHWNLINL